ncbi:MAG: hypothetical protein LUQ67_01670 [Methanomicrobiales archaeon]|nr:hypothetical protein [Methanomicrobiales archaeon]
MRDGPVKAAGILDLPEITLIEPSFSALTEDIYTEALLGIPATGARLLVDPGEDPLAVAVTDGEEWYAASFLFREPPREVIELCEDLDGEIHEAGRSLWLTAVREYYSLLLAGSVTPALEALPPDRLPALLDLLGELWDRGEGVSCLDRCCGSGAGSAAARSLGMLPLAYDNDPALLSLGLSTGRLLPGETMWIDATAATRYIDPVPRGIAVMMGEINAFTGELWEGIASEFLALAGDALITVGTEAEARRVEAWCRDAGRRAGVTENPRHAFYDRWVCRSQKMG